MRHSSGNGIVATLAFYILLIMESHGADSGIYQRIPVWDGRAASWRQFEKDMQWFLAGEDLTKVNYNLSVRIAQKQSGAVKRRAR